MSNISGTPRKVVLNGVTYDVPADANFTLNLSGYETEGQATSGRTMFKMTKKVKSTDSVTLSTNHDEADELRGLAESLADITMSVEYADGTVYKCSGKINYESFESESNKSMITLIPSDSDGWTKF